MLSSVIGLQRRRSLALRYLVCAAMFLPACSSPTAPSTSSRLTVSAVSPSRGSTTGGTEITITGSGFTAGATVSVGGVPAASVAVRSSTTLTATTAARTSAGPSDLGVTAGGTSAQLPAAFTYVAPSGANQPPIVGSMRSTGSRPNEPGAFADLGETVTITATVTDADTAPDALTYEWSGPGTFSGTGRSVSWTAPSALAATPSRALLTLTVTEIYDENGVTHRNVTTASYAISVHDSQTEILDAGEDFLTLFTHSEIPTDQVLHNFSTSCSGRGGEANDVNRARREYVEDFSKFRISRLPPVSINFGGAFYLFADRMQRADALARFQVHWELTYIIDVFDPPGTRYRRKGDHEATDGVDYVTATLENDRWLLCSSDFNGMSVLAATGMRRAVSW